jgi:ABC-type branched-subunit amino acid transport system ATPase component
MTAAILTAHGLRKSYGGVKAVNDVSFEIRADEMVAIMRPARRQPQGSPDEFVRISTAP